PTTHSMHNAYGRHTQHYRVIQVSIQFLQSLLNTPAAHIKLCCDLWQILVTRNSHCWLSLCSLLHCCLAFAQSLYVIHTYTETQRTHLHLCLAAICGESYQLGILSKAKHTYSIADLQRPFLGTRKGCPYIFRFGFFNRASWRK